MMTLCNMQVILSICIMFIEIYRSTFHTRAQLYRTRLPECEVLVDLVKGIVVISQPFV